MQMVFKRNLKKEKKKNEIQLNISVIEITVHDKMSKYA